MNRLDYSHETTGITIRRMEPPDHLEPRGEQINQRLEDNSFILGELARAKERAKHWKRLWAREVMKDPDRRRVEYGRFELDHAEQEAGFWHETDGVLERQS